MRQAFSYTRFSTPEQAEGDSARRQIDLAQAYAAKHGLVLDTSLRLRDEGVSGFRGANVRKGALGQFLQAVDDGRVPPGSLLLVESLDRVSRQNPWDALALFAQIINAGVTMVTLFNGKSYSQEDIRANSFLIMESLFVMIRANEESETKSRRLKAAWGNKRQQASKRPLTSIVPAWMRREGDTLVLVADRAAVVRRIVGMALAGSGQHRIAEALNAEGVPLFGRGAMWHRSYVKKILENPALVGTLVPHETEHVDGKRTRRPLAEVPGYFPAVVSTAEWGELLALSGKRRPQQRVAGVQNILAGLAMCSRCGSTMTRVQKGRGSRPKLVCTRARAGAGCEYHSVSMSDVEWSVRGALPWLADRYPTGDNRVDELAEKVRRAETGLQHIVDELAEHGRSPALTAARVEQESELAALEGQLREAVAASKVRQTGRPERLEDLLDADVGQINLALRTLYRHVVVATSGTGGGLSLEFEPI